MVEVQETTVEQTPRVPECLQASVVFLQQQRIRTDFLAGLPLATTSEQLRTFVRGRMRELSFPQDFSILAVMTQDPFLRDPALATLRFFVFDDTYVHRRIALEALASIPGEEYVKEIIDRQNNALPPIRTSTHQQVGTTMGSSYIS